MKKSIFFLLFVNLFFSNLSFSQYQLSQEQITNGFNYLKVKVGFKNPSSVQLNSIVTSKNKYTRECFTWAKYDVSAQNSFGGFNRRDVIVLFFDGIPIEAETGDMLFFANDEVFTDGFVDLVISQAKDKPAVIDGCVIKTPTPTSKPTPTPKPKPSPKAKPKTTSKGKL
jgi:hypothetical protein